MPILKAGTAFGALESRAEDMSLECKDDETSKHYRRRVKGWLRKIQEDLKNVPDRLGVIAETFRRLAQDLGLARKQSAKPQHLDVEFNRNVLQAGRLFLETIELGALTDWHEGQKFWLPLYLFGGDFEHKTPLAQWTDRQVMNVWVMVVLPWLVSRCGNDFKAGTGSHDFIKHKTDDSGWLLGKNGKPLKSVSYINPKTGLPGWRLSGEPAKVTDEWDSDDALTFLRARTSDHADGCRVIANLLPKAIADGRRAVELRGRSLTVTTSFVVIPAKPNDGAKISPPDASSQKQKRRRKQAKRKPSNALTPREKAAWEAVQKHGTCALAARALGKSRKVVSKQYRLAEKKVKRMQGGSRSVNARLPLPHDNRGQLNVSDHSTAT